MKKNLLALLTVLTITSITHLQAQTIAAWNYEAFTASPAGTTQSAIAASTGSGSTTGVHASAATAWSSPAGNGSAHSLSANNWAVGDYYQFQVSSVGFTNLTLTFDQTSSGTGPADFNVQYSADGGASYQTLDSYIVLANATPNPVWNATTGSSVYTSTFDFSAITALNNQSAVFFRLTDADTTSAAGGTVGTGGTSRLDNVTIAGASAVPEPSTYAMLLLSLGTLVLITMRRNKLSV